MRDTLPLEPPAGTIQETPLGAFCFLSIVLNNLLESVSNIHPPWRNEELWGARGSSSPGARHVPSSCPGTRPGLGAAGCGSGLVPPNAPSPSFCVLAHVCRSELGAPCWEERVKVRGLRGKSLPGTCCWGDTAQCLPLGHGVTEPTAQG